MPDFSPVQVEVNGSVGYLTLNEPDRLNPLGLEMLESISAAARWLDSRDTIRVIVVQGAGRAFTAGADVASFAGEPTALEARAAADTGRRTADQLEAVTAVTIARIHGHCIGGGLVLAAACDLRIAADDTQFSIPEVDLGIPLVWGGIPRLIREIGPARTKELVMTCRPFDAAEALDAGFLTRIVPARQLDEVVRGLADQIASKPAFAVTATKRHVNAVVAGMVGLARSWADADGFVTAMHDPDGREAAAAYLSALREGRSG